MKFGRRVDEDPFVKVKGRITDLAHQPVASGRFARNRPSHTAMKKTSKTTEVKVEENSCQQSSGCPSGIDKFAECTPVDLGPAKAGLLDRGGVLGGTHNSTPLKHSTGSQDKHPTEATRREVGTSWYSDCRVILDSAEHGWVSARHPRYTRAPQWGGRGWLIHYATRVHITTS